jgi:hypothetical protein
MGHASIQITFDLYGHLMPGNEREAVTLIDAFLARDAISFDLPASFGGAVDAKRLMLSLWLSIQSACRRLAGC